MATSTDLLEAAYVRCLLTDAAISSTMLDTVVHLAASGELVTRYGLRALFHLYRIPQLTSDHVAELLRRRDETIYRCSDRLFAHPHCPVIALEYVVFHRSEAYGLLFPAQNPTLNESMQHAIARKGNHVVARMLIENPCVSESTLAIFQNDTRIAVHRELLKTYPSYADPRYAAKSLSPEVRKLAAELTVDPEVAERLCYDADVRVRQMAARNPYCTDVGRIAAALLNS